MTETLESLVAEARATGRISGLPEGHFICGRFEPSATGAIMESYDPGRGEAFAQFAAGSAADVDRAVADSRRALASFRRSTPAERGRLLQAIAENIRRNAARLAVAETLDSGKRLVESLGDVRGTARIFDYYAGAADKHGGNSLPLGPDYLGFTAWEPVGVAGQIVPWNYPLSTAARGIAPALAAGCAVVLKPAEQTPMTALILASLASEAGLPAGLLNVVTGTGSEVGAPLSVHAGIDQITFTGSVPTGIRVMQEAARNVTRVVLELGGKSPLVVMADADLDSALDGVVGAIFENAGQICSAGSRLIIDAAIADEFVGRLVARAQAMQLGYGLDDPDLGPVNSLAHLGRVAAHVDAARAAGNEILCGGHVAQAPDGGKGWFYAPTVIRAAAADCIAQEEVFGPVMTVTVVDGIDEAIAVANATQYALVAGIYSRDFAAIHRFAREVDAGQIYINEYFAAGVEAPFGGNRKSGFGRAKGMAALETYSKLKSIVGRI